MDDTDDAHGESKRLLANVVRLKVHTSRYLC